MPEYRAGSGTITNGNDAVTITFSTAMPNTNYAVAVTSTNGTGWDNTNNCQYLRVGTKTTTQVTIELRLCSSGNLTATSGDMTFDYIAVANKSKAELDSAISRNDAGARQHEFTRMTILYQKVVVLGTEAENCVGEDASYVGQQQVDVEVDPSIPDEDPTQPVLPLPDVTRPPPGSPFA